jgi:hypothetical protein
MRDGARLERLPALVGGVHHHEVRVHEPGRRARDLVENVLQVQRARDDPVQRGQGVRAVEALLQVVAQADVLESQGGAIREGFEIGDLLRIVLVRALGVQRQHPDHPPSGFDGHPQVGRDPGRPVLRGQEVARIVPGVRREQDLARRRHGSRVAAGERKLDADRHRAPRHRGHPEDPALLVQQQHLRVRGPRDPRRLGDDPAEHRLQVGLGHDRALGPQQARHRGLARLEDASLVRHRALEIGGKPGEARDQEVVQPDRDGDECVVEQPHALDDPRRVQHVVDREGEVDREAGEHRAALPRRERAAPPDDPDAVREHREEAGDEGGHERTRLERPAPASQTIGAQVDLARDEALAEPHEGE